MRGAGPRSAGAGHVPHGRAFPESADTDRTPLLQHSPQAPREQWLLLHRGLLLSLQVWALSSKTSLPPRPSAPHWPWPAPSVRSRLFPQCKPGGRVLPRRHSLRAGFCPRDEHTGLGLGSCWDQREERLVFCLATGKLHVFIPLHKNLSAIC